MFSVTSEIKDGEAAFFLKGLLNTTAAPELKKEISALPKDVRRIVFDLADLEYLTSAGLRVILLAQQEMDDIGGEMIMRKVPEEIMDLFRMTGFLDVLIVE